jgi:hypothetical protein
MASRSHLVAILLLVGGAARADPSAPVIPDTPAAQTLGAWLDTFNSGDHTRIESFIPR